MASNIANQRIQREFREVVKSEEVKNSGVQVRIFRLILRGHECNSDSISLLLVQVNLMYIFVLQLSLVADDLTELAGTILGPPDTPYEGGTYKLEIKIPDTYPFNPPRVRFITKVLHNL